MVEIRCAYKDLVDLKKLKKHHKNSNIHTKEQIERLARIIEYQGIRRPIRVSNLSGLITAGHCQLEALKLLKEKKAPVDFQDYENEDQEIADIIADNSIALWAELDFSAINAQIGEFDPSFDIDLLGINNFKIDPSENMEENNKEPKIKILECPYCEEHFELKNAKVI